MEFHFVPMTEAMARQMVAAWKYAGDYAVYNYENEADHILDSNIWGRWLFAVLDESGCQVGELSMGFLDEATDDWVSDDAAQAGQLQGAILWIGFGLRPDLTGRGIGEAFVRACTHYAICTAWECYTYSGEYVGLGVYKFNQRAIKVYERVGFVTFHESGPRANEPEGQQMRLRIEDFLAQF